MIRRERKRGKSIRIYEYTARMIEGRRKNKKERENHRKKVREKNT